MPLPAPPTRKGDYVAPIQPPKARSKSDNDVLIKGILCALIGAVILVAPYVARSPSVQELMGSASVVGWFALVLGCAFVALAAKRRIAAARPQ